MALTGIGFDTKLMMRNIIRKQVGYDFLYRLHCGFAYSFWGIYECRLLPKSFRKFNQCLSPE